MAEAHRPKGFKRLRELPVVGPEQLAGGLGAFFLLTEPPERFGLPAQADSPIQENGPVANLAGVAAAFVAAGATMASMVLAHRRARR